MKKGRVEGHDAGKARVLKDFFPIRDLSSSMERFYGKQILLYGLTRDTKRAMMFLAGFNTPIAGFLVVQGENELSGMKYLGKPIFSKNDFLEMGTVGYTVLDVYGDSLQEIWDIFKIRGDTLFEPLSEPFLIYGTGTGGRELRALCAEHGVKIFCYCARSATRRDWMDDDCMVITPEELGAVDKRLPVVITVKHPEDVTSIKALLEEKGFSRIYHFDPLFFRVRFTELMWGKRTDGKYVRAFAPHILRYLRCISSGQKRIFLFSNDIPYGLSVLSTMETLGISVEGLATEAKSEYEKDPRVIQAYDLLYEDPSELLIWGLTGEEENTKEFMRKSGLPANIFLSGNSQPLQLARTYILDTHLGYANSRGIIAVRNCAEEEPALKVAVLGGSTSDYDEFFERSWPSWLLELAQEAGIRMECFMAATASNASPQELIRLIRDVIWKRPNIVISYSRINECNLVVKNHPFTHIRQQQVFEILARSSENPYFEAESIKPFSMGEWREDDAAANWLGNERMMHAICQEFGISFYGILQPYLYEKKKSRTDYELIEHFYIDRKELISNLAKLSESVKQEIPKYPWLYDFTDIFDDAQDEVFFDFCHVFGDKNRLIAEKILSIIQKAPGESV